MCCSTSVPDKLPLRHFVFDVGAGQVNGQQNQTVAQHIHSICREILGTVMIVLQFLTRFHKREQKLHNIEQCQMNQSITLIRTIKGERAELRSTVYVRLLYVVSKPKYEQNERKM